MPKNVPSLKPKELIKLLETGGVHFIEREKATIDYMLVKLKSNAELFRLIWVQKKCPRVMFCGFFDNLGLQTKRLRLF
jgi:hypothetical protein